MYHVIKFASSEDGKIWKRDKAVVIESNGDGEYAFARPCVLMDDDAHRMWYAYRGGSYSIGYAERRSSQEWIRKDGEAGIEKSPGEWDGESIEYPNVFDCSGNRYMLYCGNGYGRTGFGIAILE
jgi:hypothetical protein